MSRSYYTAPRPGRYSSDSDVAVREYRTVSDALRHCGPTERVIEHDDGRETIRGAWLDAAPTAGPGPYTVRIPGQCAWEDDIATLEAAWRSRSDAERVCSQGFSGHNIYDSRSALVTLRG